MRSTKNRFRSGPKLARNAPYPSVDAGRVSELLARCPAAAVTPMLNAGDIASRGELWIKDERERMNLGSFKALGAAYVIARHAVGAAGELADATTLSGTTYVTASAGNHGMSVAAGARIFGASAVVYIAETVPEGFSKRLEEQGARVVRYGKDYAASMDAAQQVAAERGWTLLSDSSWEGYTELPHTLMEGYLEMAAEAVSQCREMPTHIVLQAGVGGLAGAVAAYSRVAWGDAPTIVIIEPQSAPALLASILAGAAVFADGPESIMGRLDCKEPSLIALNGLARDADLFVTLDDREVVEWLPKLAEFGLQTTASGAAGVAAALNEEVRDVAGIGAGSRVLCFLTEAPE